MSREPDRLAIQDADRRYQSLSSAMYLQVYPSLVQDEPLLLPFWEPSDGASTFLLDQALDIVA